MNEDLPHWLAASFISGVPATCWLAWVEAVGGIEPLFLASRERWASIGVPPKVMPHLQAPNWRAVEQALKWAEVSHHYLLPITDPDYPFQLKQIADPPLLLYVCGNKAALSHQQLAMVGARVASREGESHAAGFAQELVEAGLAITSGLAAGIDQASHRGALLAEGITIGVAGTGLHTIYPYSSQSLVEKMLQQDGAMISEFALNTKARAYHFPQRNRIISGLSRGVFVVEAAERSGSLITARLALEQGRDVFAMPGPITHPLARGPHRLIRQGAKLVETAADILEELFPNERLTNPTTPLPAPAVTPLSVDQQTVLKHISCEITPIDVIAFRTGLTAAEVSAMLLSLELQGHVQAVTGGYICSKYSSIFFEIYMNGNRPQHVEQGALVHELQSEGFTPIEIERAFRWFATLAEMQKTAPQSAPLPTALTSPPIRHFNDEECKHIGIECRGLLFYLEQMGILDHYTREVVIDRLMALDAEDIDIGQTQWVAFMALANQPEKKTALLLLQDMIVAAGASTTMH